MNFLFSVKKTPREQLREQQRTLRQAGRDIDKQAFQIERRKKTLIIQIKAAAKKKKMEEVKMKATHIVRMDFQLRKMERMKIHMESTSLHMQSLQSNQALTEAMCKVTNAMVRMNKGVNITQMQNTLKEFDRQNETMKLKEEMIEDVLNDAMEAPDEEAETDELINKVLDGIGIDLEAMLVKTPSTKLGAAVSTSTTKKEPVAACADGGGQPGSSADVDLLHRFINLNKK